MHTFSSARAIKKCLKMKSETSSFKTIIKELGFLRKTVDTQLNA